MSYADSSIDTIIKLKNKTDFKIVKGLISLFDGEIKKKIKEYYFFLNTQNSFLMIKTSQH